MSQVKILLLNKPLNVESYKPFYRFCFHPQAFIRGCRRQLDKHGPDDLPQTTDSLRQAKPDLQLPPVVRLARCHYGQLRQGTTLPRLQWRGDVIWQQPLHQGPVRRLCGKTSIIAWNVNHLNMQRTFLTVLLSSYRWGRAMERRYWRLTLPRSIRFRLSMWCSLTLGILTRNLDSKSVQSASLAKKPQTKKKIPITWQGRTG